MPELNSPMPQMGWFVP